MVPSKCAFTLLVLASLTLTSQGARILGVFPMPLTSHQYLMTALMRGLAEKGHDVTVLTPLPQKDIPDNYKEIVIRNFFHKILSEHAKNFFSFREQSSFFSTLMLWSVGNRVCELTLPEPNVQALIHSNQAFDLIVIEAFNMECFLGFSHTFQAPVVQVSPMGGADTLWDSVGNPVPYAYVPDFSLNYDYRMSFAQRAHNALVGVFKSVGRSVYLLPRQNAIMQEFFGGSLPHINELNANTSLVLLNNHVSVSDPKPHMPNVVEVGGMHVSPPKELPQDLQKFMDESTEGIVYFSMGSSLRSVDLPPEKRDALLNAFSRIKQRVIWKWETESLPGQPKNVKLYKWLPQSDLLAHPNVKAFITHGGVLSIQEALYHGVPVIGIPVFADQPKNMRRAVVAGYGTTLDFSILTQQSVSAALDSVLNEPQYAETAKRLSRRYRDRPRTPLETAVFWCEYVIRHRGAHHMRSAAMDLYWFQYHLLDVLTVLVTGLLLGLLATYLLLRTCVRCVLPAKTDTLTSNKKRQ